MSEFSEGGRRSVALRRFVTHEDIHVISFAKWRKNVVFSKKYNDAYLHVLSQQDNIRERGPVSHQNH